jgi:hypothetical protein
MLEVPLDAGELSFAFVILVMLRFIEKLKRRSTVTIDQYKLI